MPRVDESDRLYHKASGIFRLMNEGEYAALRDDIGARGLLEPIWLDEDGSIVDGRNRHRACVELGIEPAFRNWDGSGSTVEFVISVNLHRRHLTKSEKAMAALDSLVMLEAEAKERQGARTDLDLVEIFPQGSKGKARDQAGALLGISGRYVSEAKKIQEVAPDLADQVRQAELTIPQAKRKIVQRQREETPPLPTEGKYRVLYADPPWSYGNSGIIGDDNYGHAQRHYPDMTIKELCALGNDIKTMTEKNAVLFLWVTSPLLSECFPVIKAWGFKYKTSFIWDKVRHNFGHYNSVRHEFLLICTRGSCTPDKKKLYDSVQVIERSKRHSEKPERFRQIIDTLYSVGTRIELFARRDVDGWDSWGNE